MLYHQKIYDSTAGWCFYSLSTITSTPLVGDTTPNHTNNLVAASHAVLAREPEPATGGDPRELLWEWNEVDLSQFTLAGATGDWNVTYSATGGPAGVPCIVFTTTSAAAGDLYVHPSVQPTLGDYYEMEIGLGPYTGQAANGKRCLPCPAFAYMDVNNWYGFGPGGDNIGGTGAQGLQAVQRSGGSISAAVMFNAWANHPTAKGACSAKVALNTSTTLSAAIDVYGGRQPYAYSGPTHTGRGVGLRVAHFGQTQAIGDSTYVYGWRVYGKNAF